MSNQLLLRRRTMLEQSKEVTIHGIPPITISGKTMLLSVKAFGECVQNGTPTPNNPIDIVCNNGVLKVDEYGNIYAEGIAETIKAHGKNCFDKNNLPERIYAYFSSSGTTWSYNTNGYSLRIPCSPNTTYTARYNGNSTQAVLSFGSTNNDNIPISSNQYITVTQVIRQNSPTINTPITLTTGLNDKWLIVQYNSEASQNSDMADNLQIEIGSIATSYQQYYDGGTASAEMLLNVGDFQDNQDILSGVVTRKVGACIYDGSQVIGDIFMSTTGGKDIGAIIVYPLAIPTTEQVAEQTLVLTSDTNIIDITQASLQGLELKVKAR